MSAPRSTIVGADNRLVHVGNENYMESADGLLMPTRKGQPSPDLSFFPSAKK